MNVCWIFFLSLRVLSFPDGKTVLKGVQPIHWDSASAWTIYYVNDRNAPRFPMDTLHNFRNVEVNNDSMRMFVSQAKPLEMKSPVWMGYYVASCKVPSGEKHKILISMYGGFFLDQQMGDYYEIPMNMRKDWLSYLSEIYETLETQKH